MSKRANTDAFKLFIQVLATNETLWGERMCCRASETSAKPAPSISRLETVYTQPLTIYQSIGNGRGQVNRSAPWLSLKSDSARTNT